MARAVGEIWWEVMGRPPSVFGGRRPARCLRLWGVLAGRRPSSAPRPVLLHQLIMTGP